MIKIKMFGLHIYYKYFICIYFLFLIHLLLIEFRPDSLFSYNIIIPCLLSLAVFFVWMFQYYCTIHLSNMLIFEDYIELVYKRFFYKTKRIKIYKDDIVSFNTNIWINTSNQYNTSVVIYLKDKSKIEFSVNTGIDDRKRPYNGFSKQYLRHIQIMFDLIKNQKGISNFTYKLEESADPRLKFIADNYNQYDKIVSYNYFTLAVLLISVIVFIGIILYSYIIFYK